MGIGPAKPGDRPLGTQVAASANAVSAGRADPEFRVEVHQLPLDKHGWVEGRDPSGTRCLYVRDAPNTTDARELRNMFDKVRQREEAEKLPAAARMFPDGRLKTRACYLLNLGLLHSRWELRVRPGREQDASRRCNQAGLVQPSAGGPVMWKKSEEDVQESEEARKLDLSDDDPDFTIAEDRQDEKVARLRSSLQALVEQASREQAVIVYPDYGDYDTPHFFYEVLQTCNFVGPLVSVGVHELCQVEFRGPLGKEPGWQTGVVYAGASHAFLIAGDHGRAQNNVDFNHLPHCRLAAAIASAIAGHSDVLGCGARQTLCGVLTGGGRNCLNQVAEAVRQGVPYLIFEGTGRLADYLPVAYLKRSSPTFNEFVEAQEVVRSTGFNNDPEPQDGVSVKTILSGNITVHQIKNGVPALVRILQACFVGKDMALSEAQQRWEDCSAQADKLAQPDRWLHAVYLFLSVIVTVLATVSVEIGADECQLSSLECHWLQYVVTALPLILSIALSVRGDLQYGQAAKSLNYAAALVDRAIWEYSTRSGMYADLVAVKNPIACELGGLDTTAMRAQKLTQRLVEISNEFEAEVPTRSGLQARRKCESLSKFRAAGFSIDTRGDGYIKERVQRQIERWSSEEKSAERLLLLFRVMSYIFGAAGSILALMGLQGWVTVTTAFVAALATWNSRSPVEERMRRARSTARVLKNVSAQWAAVPAEVRGHQEVMDRLVHRAEDAILAAEEAPPANYRLKQEDKVPLTG